MYINKPWFWMIAAALSIGAAIAWYVWMRDEIPMLPSERAPIAQATVNPLPLVGTASCSARGCHGNIEPQANPDRCLQTEYSHWSRDPHADAYRTLFSERSRAMVKQLGRIKEAHEEPRCLACHTTPALASIPEDSLMVRQEQTFGVGCESCHGNSRTWLAAHTAADWRTKKAAHSMPDLSDPASAAKACVGCHVGAPADQNAPLREVNHDLLAAGHPRLNFEFSVYLANLPAHWRLKKKPSEDHRWAVGQIVSAQAALELLTHRAKAGPWPEFAEYECASCHRSLSNTINRADSASSGRKPGDLAWGTWYFTWTAFLSPETSGADLRQAMQTGRPDRLKVVAQAKTVGDQLHKALSRLANEKRDALARDLLFVHLRSQKDLGWDGAEQIYLALHALNQGKADHAVATLLDELTPMRAFRSGFESAPRFDTRTFVDALQRLR